MKIGILGDTHFTNRSPRRRVDEYFQTQLSKFNQALTIFEENNCSCVVQVGDFLEAPTVSNRVVSALIKLLRACFGSRLVAFNKIYCTWGQHDVSGHSKFTLPNSPLSILESAEVVKMLSDEPMVVGSVSPNSGGRVALYGSGFGEPIPEPYEDCYNILVAHKMVGDRKIWPGQQLVGPKRFLKNHPNFDTIILGDYHYRFKEEWNGRVIVNVGALVRKTITKLDLELKPAVGILDTSDSSVQIFELEVDPVEQVFNFSKEVSGSDRDHKVLEKLVSRLRKGENKVFGWKSILSQVIEERKPKKRVIEEIDSALEEVRDG